MKIENIGPKRKIPPEIIPKILEEPKLKKSNMVSGEELTIEDFDNQSTVNISSEALKMLNKEKDS